jgi:hypothetical protein
MANLENLKKVRETIVKFKNKFNYLHYYTDAFARSSSGEAALLDSESPRVIESVLSSANDCGTCACVAGFCVSLSYAEKSFNTEVASTWWVAENWLGLVNLESHWLFEPGSFKDEKERWYSGSGYLHQFEYDHTFPGYDKCTQEQGYNEALRRLDFLIEHYSKEEQHGKLGESQEGS